MDRERGIRNIQSLRHYQIDQILEWADAHYSRTGQWPRKSSGTIAEAPEETWARVDNALLKGSRGLPGGSSLARLLAEYRGVRNRNALQPLNEDDIVRWILAYRERAGKWPTSKSGSVEDAPGETWGAVSEALRDGGRGMPGGTTLTQLIRDRCASKVGG
ncbi:MAG TPA: hypothetical protein VFJ58_00585 [Armatimonadota bacterium]|nr:hypothetical protein [Armatimonadota bacterium]